MSIKSKLSDSIERKFVEVIDINDWEVETEDGFVDIKQLNKTIPYQVYKVTLENGITLKCADTHILIDENYDEVFAINSKNKKIRTKTGISKVLSVEDLGYAENMYDLSIDSAKHTYYTNDILSHNTTSIVASILHYVTFNDEKTVALLANKGDTAREILNRIQIAFENLPPFLQHGVVEFNKGSMVLENNCRIIASSTSGSAIRGFSISFLYVDEADFVENFDEFYKSVYPTISSGKETKIVFTSTPNGIRSYYKLWKDAVEGRSGFIPIKVTWRDVPGRDEEWKRETIANTSEEAFIQEHEAEFIGSAGTLIDGWRLKELTEETPIKTGKYAKMYEAVQEGHIYAVVADVSRGKGIDNSAYIVVDITVLPYKIVSTYYCPVVPPDMFAEFIYQAHIYYNDAYVVVENNDAGCETLRVLNDTYECESILGTMTDTQGRKVISINGGNGYEFGVRTTKTVKAVGCTRAKQLVESGSIQFGDKWLIDELNKFIRVGKSYEAQKDAHDDIVMCLVIFSWLTTQYLFEDLTTIDTRFSLRNMKETEFIDDLVPFGYVTDGLDSYGDDTRVDFQSIQLPDYEDTPFFEYIQNNRKLAKDADGFFD